MKGHAASLLLCLCTFCSSLLGITFFKLATTALSFGPGRNPPHSLSFLIHSVLFHPTNTSLCLRLSSVRLREGGRRGENESLAGGFPSRPWDMWEEPHSLPFLTYYFLSLPATGTGAFIIGLDPFTAIQPFILMFAVYTI